MERRPIRKGAVGRGLWPIGDEASGQCAAAWAHVGGRARVDAQYTRYDKTWYRGVVAQVRETSGGGVAYRVEWDAEDSHSLVPASRVRPAQD